MTLRKKQIVKELEDRGADASCPMCGHSKFTFVGESEIPLSDDLKMNGDCVPTAIIACQKCGYITQHALGPLGFLSREEA